MDILDDITKRWERLSRAGATNALSARLWVLIETLAKGEAGDWSEARIEAVIRDWIAHHIEFERGRDVQVRFRLR